MSHACRKWLFLRAATLLCLAHLVQAQAPFSTRLCAAAKALTQQEVEYDPAYFSIPYPNGDVPAGKGVCTDVVIRAYRAIGIDLQKAVHEDMVKNFSLYPNKWGLRRTDTNIDHRRVPNLMVLFARHGTRLATSSAAGSYLPGDIVCWDLGSGVTHIGIVIDQKSPDGQRNLIVHNIGRGQEISDCLMTYKIIGHYRYAPR